MNRADHKKLCDDLAKKLLAEGKLIEAGFVGLRMILDPDAPPIQISEMRMAFFAGAQHLFGTIMQVLDPGSEPTDNDLANMASIADELERFVQELKLRAEPTEGEA